MSTAAPSVEPEILQPDDIGADETVDSALGDDQSSLTQSLRSSLSSPRVNLTISPSPCHST